MTASSFRPDQHSYLDTNVQPGQPYYYYFTVVKTDMSESDTSNIATATPVDTIRRSLAMLSVTNASPGLPLTLFADVTDNVGVQDVPPYTIVGLATSCSCRTNGSYHWQPLCCYHSWFKSASPGFNTILKQTIRSCGAERPSQSPSSQRGGSTHSDLRRPSRRPSLGRHDG